MAGTKFAYVRNFELPDSVIPDTYLVVRIDGKGFHNFSKTHSFAKPNDPLALELMNHSARHVMSSLKGHISLAFGESDEYSFLLRRSTTLYNRRNSKITTHIVSLFTSAYVFYWSKYFPEQQLIQPPSFDGRMVVYPNENVVRDYFSWRQADTHINNLYNTTFWALVLKGGRSEQEATKELEGTVSGDKHEILWKFGINYDQVEAMFRKGSVLVWAHDTDAAWTSASATPSHKPEAEIDEAEAAEGDETPPLLSNAKDEKLRLKIQRKSAAKQAKKQAKQDKKAMLSVLRTLHCDIIGHEFWSPVTTASSAAQPEPSSVSETHTNDTDDDVRNTRPWLHHSRLQGAGLGVSVFLD